MAADSLIDRYLDVLARSLRSRRDRGDLVDEVADHLMSAAERLEMLGIDRETAERRALARFGDPRLVASLLTSVPSKGNIMSLFFSRHLGPVAGVTAVLWIVAAVAAWFGLTEASGGWTPARYLIASALIGLACLATTAVLTGLNLLATGGVDRATVAIAVLGLAAAAACLLSWLIGLWIPLLVVAVTWTLARAWATHTGSRPFTVAMLVLMPLLAVGAIVASAIGLTTAQGTELVSWAIFAGLALVVAAGLADVAVRAIRRTADTHALPA